VAEARRQFGTPQEERRPPLEADTRGLVNKKRTNNGACYSGAVVKCK
jgi:hypothetical protein